MNILVIRLGLLGDLICTTPMLEAIKRNFPSGRLCLLSNNYNRPVVENNPYIDKLYTYIHSRQRQRNPRPGFIASMIDAIRLKRDLKREKFDWIVVCNAGFNKASVRIAQGLCGQIISATREDGSYEYRVDYPIRGLITDRYEHEIIRTFRLLAPLGITLAELPKHLTLRSSAEALARTKSAIPEDHNGPRVAVHISSRDPHREWPIEKFTDAINWLGLHHPAVQAIIVYSQQDAERLSKLKGLLQPQANAIFVAPQDVASLVAIISRSDLVLCQEGGVLHIAAGLRIPVVGLFENTPEKLNGWYPWGVPYQLIHGLPGQLIKEIPTTDVIGGLTAMLRVARHQAIA